MEFSPEEFIVFPGALLVASSTTIFPPSTNAYPSKKDLEGLVRDVQGKFGVFTLDEGEYAISVGFSGAWYNKNGTIKRADVENRIKYLSNEVAKAVGVDDKCWFRLCLYKVQSETKFVRVDIWQIIEDQAPA